MTYLALYHGYTITTPCGYVDDARASPTDPQGPTKTTSKHSISNKAQSYTAVNA